MSAVLTSVFDIVFAAAVVVAAASLAAAAFRWLSRRQLELVTVVLGGAALAAWIVFALRHGRDLALDSAGLTGCTIAAAGAVLLLRAIVRTQAMEAHLAEAKSKLGELVRIEGAKWTLEL